MKKYIIGLGGLGAFASQSFGALTNDAAAVNTALTTLAGQAEGVFDLAVPVVLAVVGLGVLISMIKIIKKR